MHVVYLVSHCAIDPKYMSRSDHIATDYYNIISALGHIFLPHYPENMVPEILILRNGTGARSIMLDGSRVESTAQGI